MEKTVYGLILLCMGVTLSQTSPLKTKLVRNGDNGPLKIYAIKDEDDDQKPMNLLDLDQWKDLLAQGKVQEMVNAIQKTLGSSKPVRVRTQWGGPDTKAGDLGNSVRNTISWGAYTGEKSHLNLILDSKFSRKGSKVDVVDPSLGFNFQLKY